MPAPLSDEIREKIVSLWNQGVHTKQAIADATGSSRATVRRVLADEGVDSPELEPDENESVRPASPAGQSAGQSAGEAGLTAGEAAGGAGQSAGEAAGGAGQSAGEAAGGAGQSAGEAAGEAGQRDPDTETPSQPRDDPWDHHVDELLDQPPRLQVVRSEASEPVELEVRRMPGQRLMYGGAEDEWKDPDAGGVMPDGSSEPPPPPAGRPPVVDRPPSDPEAPHYGNADLLTVDVTVPFPVMLLASYNLVLLAGYTGTFSDWVVEALETHYVQCRGVKVAFVRRPAPEPQQQQQGSR